MKRKPLLFLLLVFLLWKLIYIRMVGMNIIDDTSIQTDAANNNNKKLPGIQLKNYVICVQVKFKKRKKEKHSEMKCGERDGRQWNKKNKTYLRNQAIVSFKNTTTY